MDGRDGRPPELSSVDSRLWSQNWAGIPALPLTSCVTSGKFLNLSELYRSLAEDNNNKAVSLTTGANNSYFRGLSSGLNEI